MSSSRVRSFSVYEENKNPTVRKVPSGAKPKIGSRPRAALANLGNVQKSKISAEPTKKLRQERTSVALTPIQEVNPVQPRDEADVEQRTVGVLEQNVLADLLKSEAKYPIKAYNFSAIQRHPEFRRIIIDRLISVHGRFNLTQQTLFLGVNLLDRYLQTEETIYSLRLIAATAVFIATKYVEGRTLSDHKLGLMFFHTKKDVVEMEFFMLKALNFGLCRPTPLDFLDYFTSFTEKKLSTIHRKAAEYVMELTLLEYEFSSWQPSQLAAAALCTAFKYLISDNQPVTLWTDELAKLTGYTLDALLPLVEKLSGLALLYEGNKFQAVREKYSVYLWEKLNISPRVKRS